MRGVFSSAATALAVCACAQAATAATAVVDLGGTRAYVSADPAIALCGVAIFVRAGVDRETPDQNGSAALVAASILQTPIDGKPLAEAVAARGGSITYGIDTQYVRFYLEAKADALPALATLVAAAIARPAFDETELAPARADLSARIVARERDPRRVGIEMLRASHYTGAASMPTLGTAATLAGFGTAQAQAFYHRWYVSGNTFVTVVGNAGDASAAATRTLVAAFPAGAATNAAAVETRPFGVEPRRLVTSRDIAFPYIVLGFDAPSLGDADFPAAFVMRTLLRDVFDVPSATTLPSVLRISDTTYAYDTSPAQLSMWLNGGRIDPTQALTAIDVVLKRAATQPLEDATVARFRERARGEWSLANLSLDDRAWVIGNAVAHGLDPDVARTVSDAIGHVTAADIQRVAKKYFQHFDVALVLPRNGSGG